MDNQKNLLIAVILSVIILVGFDSFFNPKKNELNGSNEKVINSPENNTVVDNNDDNVPSLNQVEEIFDKKKEERIKFESERLSGTINLYGATIDDLSLNDYFETIGREKNIKILSSENSKSPYFLRMGWASTDKEVKLPNKNSLWKASKKSYSKNDKIELTWNNQKGLTFFRTISIDDNFMITVLDNVKNESSKTVNLTNFSYLRRINYKPSNKFFGIEFNIYGLRSSLTFT